jgi:cytochrome o ubiquinol oxidase subunit 3
MTSETIAAGTEAEASPTFYLVEEEGHDHSGAGGTMLGFWIYLMTDALIFATLFATYGVLSTSYVGGPVPRQIFEPRCCWCPRSPTAWR